MEIEYGPFERRVALTDPVDVDAAAAIYEAGMLTITLPLAPARTVVEHVTIAGPEACVSDGGDPRGARARPTKALLLPVLPLKDTVVFPEAVTPLAVGQERSVKLIDDVVAAERTLALVTVKNLEADPPGFDDLHEIGTLAVVHKLIKVPDGTLRILVQGTERIRLVAPAEDDPYLVARFEPLPDVRRRDARGRGADARGAGALRPDHRARRLPARGAADRGGERRRPERALPPRRLDAAPQDRRAPAAAGDGRRRASACARCS